jgi:hypothetical protein
VVGLLPIAEGRRDAGHAVFERHGVSVQILRKEAPPPGGSGLGGTPARDTQSPHPAQGCGLFYARTKFRVAWWTPSVAHEQPSPQVGSSTSQPEHIHIPRNAPRFFFTDPKIFIARTAGNRKVAEYVPVDSIDHSTPRDLRQTPELNGMAAPTPCNTPGSSSV